MWKSSDQRLSDSSSGYTATHWHSLYLAWLPGNETGVSTVIAAEAGEANHQMDKPWRKLNATPPPTYTQASMGRTKSPASNSLHRQAMERNPPPPPYHTQASHRRASHTQGRLSIRSGSLIWSQLYRGSWHFYQTIHNRKAQAKMLPKKSEQHMWPGWYTLLLGIKTKNITLSNDPSMANKKAFFYYFKNILF